MSILFCKRSLNIIWLLYAPFSQALDLPGVVKYEAIVQLSVPVSGVVNKVLVEEGNSVKNGELLLELDVIPFKADLDKAAAELRLSEAEYDLTKKEHDRNKELFERMVLSTVTLEESELNLVRTESLMQAKKAKYSRVKYDFDKSQLLAPFAGKIIERFVEPGQTIRSEMQAPVLFSLADTTGFIVEAEIDGDKMGVLSHGVELKVRIGGKTYPARVKSSILLTPGRSLSQPAQYRVRVKLDATGLKLRPGIPAVLVVSGQRE